MKMFMMMLTLLTVVSADTNLFLPMFVETGSMMQTSFNGGGAALADKANGISLNPASLYAYHKLYGKRIGFNGSYVNDKDGRILANGGGSYAIDPKNVVAVDYLLHDSRTGEAQNIHKASLAYSAIVQEEKGAGILSWGLNISYYQNSGDFPAQTLLNITTDSTVTSYPTGMTAIRGAHHAVTTDLGFYQSDNNKGVSYAVVLENIFGYKWDQRDNTIETIGRDSVVNDSVSIRIDTTRYSDKELKENGILKGRNKSLLIGLAVQRPLAGGNVILTIPFDVRFWGFLDKDLRKYSAWKNRCMLRTGAETNFGDKLSFRVGYSWAPRDFTPNENGDPRFRNHHQASGGFKLALGVADVEMAFKDNEFAIGGSLYF